MFKLDNDFLTSLGLGNLPVDEKNRLLQMIYERLEMNVGMRLAEKMSDQQLDEFETFIDGNIDYARNYLNTNKAGWEQGQEYQKTLETARNNAARDNRQLNEAAVISEFAALQWLSANFPNYKDVVAEELEKLKGEVTQAVPQILAAQGQGAMPAPQPMQQQQYQQAPMPQAPMQPQYAQPQPQQYAPQPMQQPMQPAYQQPQQPQYQPPAQAGGFNPNSGQPQQPQYAPAQPVAPQPTPTPQYQPPAPQPQQPAPQPAPTPQPQPSPAPQPQYQPPTPAQQPLPPAQPQQPQQFTPPPPGFNPQ